MHDTFWPPPLEGEGGLLSSSPPLLCFDRANFLAPLLLPPPHLNNEHSLKMFVNTSQPYFVAHSGIHCAYTHELCFHSGHLFC